MHEHHQDVEEAAKASLCGRGYAELTNVTCEYDEARRVLTLHGCVSSYYLKQHAQEAVRSLNKVDRVDNRIRVADR
jgi:osmotically-inducible protein OsmY